MSGWNKLSDKRPAPGQLVLTARHFKADNSIGRHEHTVYDLLMYIGKVMDDGNSWIGVNEDYPDSYVEKWHPIPGGAEDGEQS